MFNAENINHFRGLFKPFINKGDWVLDIGANDGDSTLPMAELVGDEGMVIAFEPCPNFFIQLKKNIPNSNCHLYNVAVSTENKKMLYGFNKNNGGLIEGFDVHERGKLNEFEIYAIDVSSFLIDKYPISDLKKIKFIKTDTEGYEATVLRGLKTILDICKPTILAEWWFYKTKNEDFFKAIQEIGYEAFTLEGEKRTAEDFDKHKCQDLVLKPL